MAVSDILYDCNSFMVKINQSKAIKELCERGPETLKGLVELFATNPECLLNYEVRIMFGMVFADIESILDREKTGPERFDETELWIEWAKKFIPET